MKTFWLREETKPHEFRRALVPSDCEKLIQAGHRVVVEDWKDSIIDTDDYKRLGCEIARAGSWKDSDPQNIIIGLKALPDEIEKFEHTHIYFAHVYKNQDGWKETLSKFKLGNGSILDLEFMLNEQGRRVCAFGYWAGYVGAALALLFSQSVDINQSIHKLNEVGFFPSQKSLKSFLVKHTNEDPGRAIIIGASGRSGSGAQDLFKSFNWQLTCWDRRETAKGGPFLEILDHDVFVNCVLSHQKINPFMDKQSLSQNKSLKVISDVSCDPDSECNTLPIYSEATTLERPITDLGSGVFLTAIDNLPSILPKESSEDFSSQLVEHLLDIESDRNYAMTSTKQSFDEAMSRLEAL